MLENNRRMLILANIMRENKRKGLHNREIVQTRLAKFVPSNFQLGEAIGKRDRFLDAVAQGLNQLSSKILYSYKSLRALFGEYVKNPQGKWVEQAVNKDGSDPYQYLACVGYAPEEIEILQARKILIGTAEWENPNPHIEGRMICDILQRKNQLNINIHLLEISDNEEDILEQYIDAQGSRPITPLTGEDYHQQPNTIHVVIYKDHCVPLLKKTTNIASNNSVTLSQESADYFVPKTATLSGKLHDNKRDLYIDGVSQTPNLAGQVCELVINDCSLKIVIGLCAHPSNQRYNARLWVNQQEVKDVFTLVNNDPILCTKFQILEVDNLEEFVKNAVLSNKKRKISHFFVDPQRNLPEIAKSGTVSLKHP